MSSPPQISPALQDRIARLQQLEQQLVNLQVQLQQVAWELKENNDAMKNLEGLSSTLKTFKITESILVETDREILKKELEDQKELLEFRESRTKQMLNQQKKAYEKLQKRVREELTQEGYNVSN
ncbi:MAG: prefoldin subunit [Promethearchaeota archaeon]